MQPAKTLISKNLSIGTLNEKARAEKERQLKIQQIAQAEAIRKAKITKANELENVAKYIKNEAQTKFQENQTRVQNLEATKKRLVKEAEERNNLVLENAAKAKKYNEDRARREKEELPQYNDYVMQMQRGNINLKIPESSIYYDKLIQIQNELIRQQENIKVQDRLNMEQYLKYKAELMSGNLDIVIPESSPFYPQLSGLRNELKEQRASRQSQEEVGKRLRDQEDWEITQYNLYANTMARQNKLDIQIPTTLKYYKKLLALRDELKAKDPKLMAEKAAAEAKAAKQEAWEKEQFYKYYDIMTKQGDIYVKIPTTLLYYTKLLKLQIELQDKQQQAIDAMTLRRKQEEAIAASQHAEYLGIHHLLADGQYDFTIPSYIKEYTRLIDWQTANRNKASSGSTPLKPVTRNRTEKTVYPDKVTQPNVIKKQAWEKTLSEEEIRQRYNIPKGINVSLDN